MPDHRSVRAHAAILPAVLALGAIAALSACSDGGAAYPSLASRPAEQLTEAAAPTTVTPTSPPTPAAAAQEAPSADLVARLDDLVSQARSAKRGFDDQRPAVERLVAAAGTAEPGSEAWARGTQALSGIESARTLTAQPLADLDRIDVDDRLAHAAQDGPHPNEVPRADALAIATAHDAVAALVADEDAVLAKLDGRLAR